MNSRCFVLFAGTVFSLQGQVFFSFDYSLDTSGYFAGANSYRQNTLEAAAQRVSAFLSRQSLSTVSGGPQGNAIYIINPSSDGTGITQLDNVSVGTNEIRIYVGAYNYGSGVLAQAGPGQGFSYEVNTESFTNRGTSFNPPMIGSISFNTNLFTGDIYWDQDVSNFEDPNPGSPDFDAYTFIQHELLHVLGIGTSNDWSALVDPTIRTFVSNPNVPPPFGTFNTTSFIGSHSVSLVGGPVPLSSDQAHPHSSVKSTTEDGAIRTPLMSPLILNDERKELTLLDLAMLKDIGWSADFPASHKWTFTSWNLEVFAGSTWAGTSQTSANADPDGDGMPNLLEYALDLNPTQADGSNALITELINGSPALTFMRRKDTPDLLYLPEASNDLVDWFTGWVEMEVVSEVDSGADLVRTKPSIDSGGRYNFVRLKVSILPQ